ncbi:hypothetical protein EPI10_011640 [Gossypium australe]|uniref:Uncharacterized protein n=1 Tax=Gossypium australe TaxID=47621 RepID=A0A5B6W9L0_9ROSI|nr:hypothetical protein EPI10_011640 [Gossypium australe]
MHHTSNTLKTTTSALSMSPIDCGSRLNLKLGSRFTSRPNTLTWAHPMPRVSLLKNTSHTKSSIIDKSLRDFRDRLIYRRSRLACCASSIALSSPPM